MPSQACRSAGSSTGTATSSASRSRARSTLSLKALARFHVKALDVHEADLEDVFLARYRGGEPDAA